MEIPSHVFIYVALSAILSLLHQTLADSPPIFRKEPSSEAFKRNSRVKLKCKTDPKDADVRWVFNGEEVADSDELGVTVKRGSLVIEAFQDELHQGDYQCIASNNVGAVISRVAHIQVAYIQNFPKTLPDRTYSIAGHVAAIDCPKPDSLPPAIMEYYFNGKLIEQNDHYRILPSGSLHILDVSSLDEGEYGCRAINPVTSRTRDQFNATVLQLIDKNGPEEPASISIASGVTAEVNHHAILECVPHGIPYPYVRWQKQGGELPETATQHHGYLKIGRVTEEDAGVYECIVENNGGTVTKEVTLEVFELPEITKSPKSVSVGQGGAAQFKCGVTGASENDITWLHNAQPIPQNDYYMVQKTTNEVSLIVADVTRTQLGVYQCIVRTKHGMDHASAVLKFREGFPRITIRPINTTAIEGENVKLSCVGSGDPSPNVRWTGPGGRSIGSRRTMLSSDGLTIYSVGPTDQGWYQCSVSNRLGAVNADVYLAIIEKLSPTELPAARKTVGKPLSSDDGNMTVQNTEEPDKPGTVPDTPSKPEIFRTSDTSVDVRWEHTETSATAITRYIVIYRNILSDPDWLTASSAIDPFDRSYEVRNLTPGGIYRFKVIAGNQYGESTPSEVSHRFYLQVSTPTVRPVTAPKGDVRIIRCKAVGSTTIEVIWEYTPHQYESPIDGYYIYHRDTDSDDDRDYIRTPVVGQDETRYRINKLEPEVSYDIKMASFNGGGESGFSNVVIVPTPAQEKPITIFPINGRVIPTHEQNNGMPDIPDSPDDSPQNDQSKDILYITVGVMLGVILLCVIMFGVMCVWRAKQVNNDRMNRMEQDWRCNGPYYEGSYRYVDTNGSTPHYKYHQVNGSMNGGLHHPPNHVYTQGIGHLPFGETATAIDSQPMFPLSENGISERALMSSQPVISNGHGPYPTSPGQPVKIVPLLPRTRSEPAQNGFVPARSHEGPLNSGSSSEHLQANGSIRSGSSRSRHDDGGVSSGGESGRSRSKWPKCPHRHHKADVNKAVRRQPNEHPTSREGSIGSSLDCASLTASSPPPTPNSQLAPPLSTHPPPRSDGTDSLHSRSRSSSNLSDASSCRNVKHSDIF